MGSLLHLNDAHERAQLLIPWRANGTLEEAEAALLEAHLAECAQCRADLEAETALRAAVAGLPWEHEPAEPARLPRLRQSAKAPRTPRRRGLARPVPLGWALAGPAAAAAIAVLAFVLVPQSAPSEAPGYRLLGSNEPAGTGNVIVLFAPETPERELRAALGHASARLVDGPTASGAYVARVPSAEREAAIARLRSFDQVVLAEPIDAGDGP